LYPRKSEVFYCISLVDAKAKKLTSLLGISKSNLTKEESYLCSSSDKGVMQSYIFDSGLSELFL
jgi:hypothetical protein